MPPCASELSSRGGCTLTRKGFEGNPLSRGGADSLYLSPAPLSPVPTIVPPAVMVPARVCISTPLLLSGALNCSEIDFDFCSSARLGNPLAATFIQLRVAVPKRFNGGGRFNLLKAKSMLINTVRFLCGRWLSSTRNSMPWPEAGPRPEVVGPMHAGDAHLISSSFKQPRHNKHIYNDCYCYCLLGRFHCC